MKAPFVGRMSDSADQVKDFFAQITRAAAQIDIFRLATKG